MEQAKAPIFDNKPVISRENLLGVNKKTPNASQPLPFSTDLPPNFQPPLPVEEEEPEDPTKATAPNEPLLTGEETYEELQAKVHSLYRAMTQMKRINKQLKQTNRQQAKRMNELAQGERGKKKRSPNKLYKNGKRGTFKNG